MRYLSIIQEKSDYMMLVIDCKIIFNNFVQNIFFQFNFFDKYLKFESNVIVNIGLIYQYFYKVFLQSMLKLLLIYVFGIWKIIYIIFRE